MQKFGYTTPWSVDEFKRLYFSGRHLYILIKANSAVDIAVGGIGFVQSGITDTADTVSTVSLP